MQVTKFLFRIIENSEKAKKSDVQSHVLYSYSVHITFFYNFVKKIMNISLLFSFWKCSSIMRPTYLVCIKLDRQSSTFLKIGRTASSFRQISSRPLNLGHSVFISKLKEIFPPFVRNNEMFESSESSGIRINGCVITCKLYKQ